MRGTPDDLLVQPKASDSAAASGIGVRSRVMRRRVLATASVLAMAFASPALAQTAQWQGTNSNDWFDAGNWDPAATPGPLSPVRIDTSPGAIIDGAAADASTIIVGEVFSSTLTIQNGGSLLTTASSIVGFGPNSNSSLTVTGAGSVWTANGSTDQIVGANGHGEVRVLSGGVIDFSALIGATRLGNATGANGTLLVDGAGSAMMLGGPLQVGVDGDGLLTISNGGQVTSASSAAIVSQSQTSSGVVVVDGAGSLWAVGGEIIVGANGVAIMTVQNGATVDAGADLNRDTYIARGSAVAAVTVTGVGTTWTSHGRLHVGDLGDGSLVVSAGASLTSAGGVFGEASSGIGNVVIDGAGSSWTSAGEIIVGAEGDGTLTIANGGDVSSQAGIVADEDGSIGAVTVSGAGSSWDMAQNTYVGFGGVGTLSVLNGGAITGQDGLIGLEAGSNGHVEINGAGSSWITPRIITVGFDGAGVLDVTNGGVVISQAGYIGDNAGSTGLANVSGSDAFWDVNGVLHVGFGASGTLNISDEGGVEALSVVVGSNPGGTGAVTLDGDDSSLTALNSLFVAEQGAGTLLVQNGAELYSLNADIGREAGSDGELLIDGAQWLSSGNMRVGVDGEGALIVTNGGVVASSGVSIGGQTGVGSGLVTGAGSIWSNTGAFAVGGGTGSGTLIVNNGGFVDDIVTLLNHGRLGGHNGTVAGIDVLSGGVVAPGNSIGTINVSGAASFGAGSVYEVEVSPAGQSDLLDVVGAVTINNGASVNVLGVGGAFTAGVYDYTIIDAGSVVGTFGSVTDDLAFYTALLSYSATSVTLHLERNDINFGDVGLTPNQIAVGDVIEDNVATPGMDALLDDLLLLTNPEAVQALADLAGEVNATAPNLVNDATRNYLDVLGQQAGVQGAGNPAEAQLRGRVQLASLRESDAVLGGGARGGGLWGTVFGGTREAESDAAVSGYDGQAAGLAFGVDREVHADTSVGVSAGVVQNDLDLEELSGEAEGETVLVGAYARWGTDGPWRAAGAVSFGWSNVSMKRSIAYLSSTARGEFDATGFGVQAEAGYAFELDPDTQFELIASFQGVRTHQDGYTETGAGVANLIVADDTSSAARIAVGGQFNHDIGALATYARVLWANDFQRVEDNRAVALSVLADTRFTIIGHQEDSQALLAGFGLNGRLSDHWQVGLAYDGVLRDNASAHAVSGALRYAW